MNIKCWLVIITVISFVGIGVRPVVIDKFAGTNQSIASQLAIVRFLEAEGVSMKFRKNERLPYHISVYRDVHQLHLVAEIQTVESIIISYPHLIAEHFEPLTSMRGLQHLCVYGFSHDYEPNPGEEDHLLDIFASLTNLKILQLGNVSELYSLEMIISMLGSLNLERFTMFRTSREFVDQVKQHYSDIYEEHLEFPFE